MIRVKRRTFSGCVCEQEIYMTARSRIHTSEPKPRFKTEEERQQFNSRISRRNHIRLVNENFTPASLYTTLTFDTEHEIHCPSRRMQGKYDRYGEALTEAYKQLKKVRDNFVRRLRRKYPEAVIFIYMGRGSNTDRMHLHMLSDGVPEEEILKQWSYGYICRIENLRPHNIYNGTDHGQDYTGLANYLFDHYEKEQGKHRYKATRNAKKPEREEAKACVRQYSEDKPPKAPRGYVLVDTYHNEYGYQYFKYVIDPEADKDTHIYRRKRKKT